MKKSIIEVKHLKKSFGNHEVLKDINFSVKPGDVTSIIGASGSGKSTLLRCINLLETPTSGEILYNNEDVLLSKNIPSYRAKVGMVFQNFNLFENMNVLQNCMIGLTKVLKLDKEKAKNSPMLDSTSRDFSSSSIPIQMQSQTQEPPTEQEILLRKQAVRSQNLNAIQGQFFAKNYKGTENTITIDYENNNTYKIRTRIAMTSTMIFPQKIKNFILGDNVGFEVLEVPNSQNTIAIRPKLIGVDTSLAVFTEDGKLYSFYIFSTDFKSWKNPHLVVFVKDKRTTIEKSKDPVFNEYFYVEEGINKLREKKKEVYKRYKIKAKKQNTWLMPEEVFSDNNYTFFKYDKTRYPQIPSVYVVVDKQDSPIETRVIGDFVIAETVADKFTIRIGEAYVCIEREKAQKGK